MKIYIYISLFVFSALGISAQDDIYPAKPQEGVIVIKNGNIHTGTGEVISQGTIVIENGKIKSVGSATAGTTAGTVIDASGREIYPGLILPNTDLGLKEIASGVRGSNDYSELGDYNTSVRSIVAYNTDSKIINTLRANGILLAGVAPEGNLLTGYSSVVQLDAWTWEDALYQADYGLHLNMPALMAPPHRSLPVQNEPTTDPLKEGLQKVAGVKQFLQEAKAYSLMLRKQDVNLKFEALKPLFEKKQKLFVHADRLRQILLAIDLVKDLNIDMVLVGGADSHLVTPLLKQHSIPVILNQLHNLPVMEDDDIDQPFKTPFILQQAGVLFALNDDDGSSRYRNLAFEAGTAVAYGLTKEQALQAITLNPAKILGIADRTGSLEAGKDANIIISEGDILDMQHSKLTDAFIQGRKIDLSNKQTQLYERYKYRYGLK